MKGLFYVVTRRDLEPGVQLAQSVHAAMRFCAEHGGAPHWAALPIAVLAAPDEASLGRTLREARGRGLKVAAFHEPDLADALTAIALEPEGQRLCARFPKALSAP